ncbi:MAG: hypothetical protein ABFS02_04545 [Pseudomonadota bacterium]
MITGLKPYPRMKDSGVAWLGEVPEHWEVRRLKGALDPERPITYGIVQCGENIADGVPSLLGKTGIVGCRSGPGVDQHHRQTRFFLR